MNKILIVDDEESIRLLYHDELSEAGYTVFTLGNGSKVLKTIEQWKPDLVVLDIKLGRYNGLDLLQEIRNTRYDLPVILCTAYSCFRYDQRSIAADYYVVKRSNMDELKLKIKMALEGGEYFLSGIALNPNEKNLYAPNGHTPHLLFTGENADQIAPEKITCF